MSNDNHSPEITPADNAAIKDSPPAQQPIVRQPPLTRSESLRVLPAAGAAALLYAVCFSGTRVLPQISFTLFCAAALLLITGVLKSIHRFNNKKAFWWTLPIGLLAACNGIFHANPFTWGNAMLMHGLFAAFTVTALREQPLDLFNLSGFGLLVRMVLGNWIAFIDVIRVAVGGRAVYKSQRIKHILLGVLLAFPVLMIITALLMSADAVFGRLADDFFGSLLEVKWINAPFIISLVLGWIYAVGYICLGIRKSRDTMTLNFSGIKAETTVCATFLSLVNAVFLLFTFIQIAFLFNGGFLRLPEDMIYSQYAREGFFQLLFVTFINFSVIFVFMTVLTGVQDNKILRGLLLALCFFTGVLIVSSFYRMGLYTGAYGHTTLRLCVYTFLSMETVLLGITVWKLFSSRVPFVRWFVLTGLTFYIIVNVTGSDYFAAKLNAGLLTSGRLDYIDLVPVGPDGIAALEPLFLNDDYIQTEGKLRRKSNLPNNTAETREGYNPRQTYIDYRDNYPDYYEHWQNWSYLKIK